MEGTGFGKEKCIRKNSLVRTEDQCQDSNKMQKQVENKNLHATQMSITTLFGPQYSRKTETTFMKKSNQGKKKK